MQCSSSPPAISNFRTRKSRPVNNCINKSIKASSYQGTVESGYMQFSQKVLKHCFSYGYMQLSRICNFFLVPEQLYITGYYCIKISRHQDIKVSRYSKESYNSKKNQNK